MPHEPDLTPTEEQVRRLLADARHTEPMPEAVAARLDGVIADLAAGGAAGGAAGAERPRPSELTRDLAAARRRRTARNLLIAAAAVVVVGVGVNQVDLTVSGGSGDSADSAAGGDTDGAGRAADEVQPNGAAPAPRDLNGLDGARFSVAPVRLTSERFGTQVRRLQDRHSATLSDSQASGAVRGHMDFDRLEAVQCPTTGWGGGRFVIVRYDGDLGALVFRRVRGDTQVVDLFLCGSDQPTRSVTLPVR